MTLPLERIEEEALKLSEQERTQLIERLLGSFREQEDAISLEWAAEASRRNQAIDEGRLEESPASEVLARIRARNR